MYEHEQLNPINQDTVRGLILWYIYKYYMRARSK